MKQKIRAFFKRGPYWIGILVFGTILGISLQLTRAWVEPTLVAPSGNVGAPITTGPYNQIKIDGSISTNKYMLAQDFYIMSIDKWASELDGTPPPPAPVVTYLVNGNHNTDQCVVAGGSVFETGSVKFCKFAGASCPTGWSWYRGWSTTAPKTCGAGNYCNPSVTTGSHPFSDNGTIERSSYNIGVVPRVDNPTMCSGGYWGADCYAIRTEVGCY